MRQVRRERLRSTLKREIAEIVRFDVNLPENLFITIQDVELSKDGSKAYIYVSALKKEDAIKAVDILNRASGYIHHLLGKRLKLRVVPKPEFHIHPGDLL